MLVAKHTERILMIERSATGTAVKGRRGPGKPRIVDSEVSRMVNEIAAQQQRKLLETKVEVSFTVRAGAARSVSVAGTFNGWSVDRNPLESSGEWWRTKIAVPRGRYEYRFIVDGQWQTDPGAQDSVPNPFGTVNSVLIV